MKKVMLIAALAALSACSENAPAPEPTETASAAPVATSAPVAVDGKPSAGTYKITDAKGDVATWSGSEDGTFTMTMADGSTVSGTWTENTPGNVCQTVDGKESCSTETIVDGVWTSTDPDGTTYTIERVEAGAPATE